MTGEYFERRRTNMVTSAQSYLFPPSVGVGGATPPVNIGEVRYRGWDLSFKHLNTIGNFKYHVTFNMSRTTDKVLDWGDESAALPNMRRKAKHILSPLCTRLTVCSKAMRRLRHGLLIRTVWEIRRLLPAT